MNLKVQLIGIAFIAFSSAALCQGYWKDYSPFEPGKEPAAFPLKKLSIATINEDRDNLVGEYKIKGSAEASPKIHLLVNNKGCSIQVLFNGKQETLAGTEDCGLPWHSKAWSADLNGDHLEDIIIVNESGACGMGEARRYISISLSSPKGYKAIFYESYDSSEQSFVDLNQDGRPEFILSSFIFSEKGKDGKKHNYFIYNLLTFEGDEIVSANAIDKRFPSWIWYSFKPNHRNTGQLTSEQRLRLWRERHQQYYDKLPVFKALEEEQGISE